MKLCSVSVPATISQRSPARAPQAPVLSAGERDRLDLSGAPDASALAPAPGRAEAQGLWKSEAGLRAAAAAVGGSVGHVLRLVLVGAPGSGKGTQADILEQIFGVPHISTGAILREEVKQGTELGKQADAYMKAGQLVPDELIFAIMEPRLDKLPGFILDGFPRSLSQAEKLDGILKQPLTAVAVLDCDDELLVKRMLARGREDDTEEVIRERLKVYHQQTEPVLQYYEQQGLVQHIPAEGSIPVVARALTERMAGTLYK